MKKINRKSILKSISKSISKSIFSPKKSISKILILSIFFEKSISIFFHRKILIEINIGCSGEANGRLDRRMTAREAHWFLRGFLVSSGFKEDELDLVECHSLECTLPSWASKGWYLTISDRLLRGHNLTRESQSAFVYGRDELTRIAGVVYQMVRDIRNKKFCPDAFRAERVALYVGLMVSDGEQESPESSDEDAAMPEDVKQLKVWIVTEQVGMTSSLMSCKGLESCCFRGYSYQVVPR